ncbi:lanthionine synthetase LanC family protein [Pedobacter caeni]|uniref:Lanthionine synthetase C-like protein n=1 Tax=Pedobacter caeni TaxID=288992 RepID=A0A1M5HFH8_9SPHI|nr:lanthionine synthetase LanC family protein [Pedobacter caeni]SHG14739.1 Lanthionine synthetase C-like protein [Pedobacter caeni]
MPSFDPKQTEKISEQVQRLNNDLLSAAIRDHTGLCWPSPYYTSTGQFSFKETIDIFNGSSGIALYFMALFEYSGRKEDLKTAEDILRKALKSEEVLKARSFGFYTGISGVVYACIRFYELSGKKKYLNTAFRLIRNNEENIINNTVKADFLSGYSGSLFVITLLYHHLQSDVILTMIRQMITRVTTEARISKTGLKWDYDRSKSAFDSLTGFSHGASGIAYSLMQVGNYFKNEGLIYLAEQALRYEMQYFHEESDNWLDLRLGSYRLSLPDAHRWDLNLFLPEMRKVNSWAHGAAGIGLARLYAWQTTGNPIYLDQCKTALNRCLSDIEKMDRTDFSLCSGYTGMIPFLLKFQELRGYDFNEQLCAVARQAKQLYEQKNSYNSYISSGPFDYGLLSGKAGIGYMLLQLLNPEMTSAVYPALPLNTAGTIVDIGPDKKLIRRGIFFQYYPKTIQLLDLSEPDFTEHFYAEDLCEFEDVLNQKINTLPDTKVRSIMEVFNFEHQRTSCWKAHKGYLCYAKKNEFIRNQYQQLSLFRDEELLDLEMKLADHVTFYPITPEWRAIMELKETDQAALFLAEESGMNTIYIGQLPKLVISPLGREAVKGNKLISVILNGFIENDQRTSALDALKQRLISQIRSLIRVGIISIKV